jgi:uncharacterized membrane-anchored protein
MKLTRLQSRLQTVDRKLAAIAHDIRAQCDAIDLLSKLGSSTVALEAELAGIVRELAYSRHQRDIVTTRIDYLPESPEVVEFGHAMAA